MIVSQQRRWVPRILEGKSAKIFRQPVYIFWLSLLAIGFFAFTFGMNRLYAQKQRQLSEDWYRKAQSELDAKRPGEAISDLRTALVYSHDNPQYRFMLAQALAADGRDLEARSYFLGLLDDEPGNGSYNLELARLAEKDNDTGHALRYFNGAIYGAWDSDPVLKRQQVRQEFVNYLLGKGLATQARGELLTFTTEMPKTSESELWTADAFSRLGDNGSALDFYKTALHQDRHNAKAMFGAGEAAFRMARYREALEYFRRADATSPNPGTAQLLQLTSLVLDLNPFESRLPAAERRHRLVLAMDIADHRLRQCAQTQNIALDTPGTNQLQLARAQWIELDNQMQKARGDADVIQMLTPVAALIVGIEQQSGCGAPLLADQAALYVFQNAEELQP